MHMEVELKFLEISIIPLSLYLYLYTYKTSLYKKINPQIKYFYNNKKKNNI